MADVGIALPIISRKEAKERGLTRFFTGEPCHRHGHIAERAVCNNDCVQCRDDRVRKWNALNTQRRRKIRLKWLEENRERHLQSQLNWANRNRAKINEQSKVYYAANRARHNAITKAWRIANPLNQKVHSYVTRARRVGWSGATMTLEYYRNMIDQQEGRCAYCNEHKTLVFEHVQALAREGTHDPANCVLSCAPCNREKWLDPLPVFLERIARKKPHLRISTVDDVKKLLEAPWRQFALD